MYGPVLLGILHLAMYRPLRPWELPNQPRPNPSRPSCSTRTWELVFYEYVNRYRAGEAAELLRSGKGKFSIADVAYVAGFNNANTFYKEFKRVYGVWRGAP